jgi:hypothetical protein
VEGDVAVTYPKDLSWQEEALLQALFARDYPADAKAVAGDWPEGVPERVEVTAAYRCGCPEVADITQEQLDKALKGARLKGLLEMYDCKIPADAVLTGLPDPDDALRRKYCREVGLSDAEAAAAAFGVCPGCGEEWPCGEVRELSAKWGEQGD